MTDYCEHGHRKGKRCPVCGERNKGGGKQAQRRSVYEDRDLDGAGVGQTDEWRRWQYGSIGIRYTAGWRRWPR